MTSKYSITYDFGTGSVKAAILNSDKQVVGSCSDCYPMYSPRPGFAEQKVEDYRASFLRITKKLMREAHLSGEDINGIVISQTSSSVIFADAEGNPLCDCVTWVDSRAGEQAGKLNERIGVDGWTTSKRVTAKVKWFMEKRPEVVAGARYLLDVSSYFYLLLTGQTAYDVTAAYATGFMFPIGREWSETAVHTVGINPSLLPDRILWAYEIVGYTVTDFAREAGLSPKTPVFAGCSDNANGHLGTGCIEPGDAHIYMGSSGWFSVTMPIHEKGFSLMPSAIPGIGYAYYCTNSVGTCIDYVIKEFYQKETGCRADYELMACEAMSVESNLKDVIFLPYLFGEEAPVDDPAVRGTLLNLDSTVTRGHIARAVMEGIAFNYRWNMENFKESGGGEIRQLKAIGGGAQSDAHMQIMVDVMQMPVTRLVNARFAGNIGLSVCIDIGLGMEKDFSVLKEYAEEDKVFTPRKEFRERYDRLFASYKNSYFALKDLYHNLNS